MSGDKVQTTTSYNNSLYTTSQKNFENRPTFVKVLWTNSVHVQDHSLYDSFLNCGSRKPGPLLNLQVAEQSITQYQ